MISYEKTIAVMEALWTVEKKQDKTRITPMTTRLHCTFLNHNTDYTSKISLALTHANCIE